MKNLLTIILILLFFNLSAQSRYELKGDENMSNSKYEDALENYKKDKRKTDNVYRKISKTYYKLGRYDKAESSMRRIGTRNLTGKDFLSLAEINIRKQDFAKATSMVNKAKEKGIDKLRIENSLTEISSAKRNSINKKSILLKETILNLPGKGLGVSLFNDYLFYSRLVNSGSGKNYTPVFQLYKTKYKEKEISRGRIMSKTLDPKNNIGAINLSKNGKQVLYTRWIFRNNSTQIKQLVKADLVNDSWSNPKALNFCSKKYSVAYPCLSSDEQTLYFSSNMPGGFGGMDIYKSQLVDNEWAKPINLGAKVNSSGNEIYPFLKNDDLMYFCSDGHMGLGGLDIFSSHKNNNIWSSPENLGAPINSIYNDYSYMNSKSGDYRFFVSDRKDKGRRDRVYHIFTQMTDTISIHIRDSKTKKLLVGAHVNLTNVNNSESLVCFRKNGFNYYQFEESLSNIKSQIEYTVAIVKDNYLPKDVKFVINEKNKSLEVFIDRDPLALKQIASVKEIKVEKTIITKTKIIVPLKPKVKIQDNLKLNPQEKLMDLNANKLSKVIEATNVEFLHALNFNNKKHHFNNLYFTDKSSVLSPESLIICNRLIKILKSKPLWNLNVNAHAFTGENSFYLSKEIILNLKHYFNAQGISDNRLRLRYWGDHYPTQEEGTYLNPKSRVELIIVL